MILSKAEISSMFQIRGLLKPNESYFRSETITTSSMVMGLMHSQGIYDIHGFEVKLFSEKEILDLIDSLFKMLWIKEEH